MITGESRPVAKGEGDRVVAGTVATDSAIRVRVTAVGEETALAGIQRLVAEAQASRSRTQALADRAAALLFYVAVGAAVVTFVVWALLGDGDAAVDQHRHRAGHLLPARARARDPARDRDLDLARGSQRASSSRTASASSGAALVDVVLFDKTGTLTRGEHVVTDVAGRDRDAVLAAGRRGRVGERASARARDRGRRARARLDPGGHATSGR